MKMLTLVAATALAVSIALVGCGKGSDSTVLARINRTKITVGDFKKQVEELPPQMQQALMADPKARKDFLNNLVAIELVLQEAQKQGLDKTAEYKKAQEQRKKAAERQLEEAAKNDLFESLLKKEISTKLSIPTDQEVKDYYNAHQNEMRTPEGKKLSFKEASADLKTWLIRKKQNEVFLNYAGTLKDKAKVTIDEKALDSFPGPSAQVPQTSSPMMGHPPVK